MKTSLIAGLLLFGFASAPTVFAQGADPALMREVTAVRESVATSNLALRHRTWVEHTEVLVKGEVKSSTDLVCRYDNFGKLTKTPAGEVKEKEGANALSNRPIVRKKADMEDYIERAVSLIHSYLPPKPEQMQYLLQNGYAFLGQAAAGKSEIRFKRYLQDGDSLVFTYDSASKALLRINVAANLGSPKDPVTMEAIFETLPDGVNHLATTTLNAPAKKVQVKTKNSQYQKVAN